jgi:hypothetical protein
MIVHGPFCAYLDLRGATEGEWACFLSAETGGRQAPTAAANAINDAIGARVRVAAAAARRDRSEQQIANAARCSVRAAGLRGD